MTKKDLNKTVSRLVNNVVAKIAVDREPTAADEDRARTLVDMALCASEDKLMAAIPVVCSI
ncbi:MAG: hypothetical protein WC919_00835 [Candidatus Paceibacterota bacterium]|jgi:hypothetical protein